MTDKEMWNTANRIAQESDAHTGYAVWKVAGKCLESLIVPSDRHPLAVLLSFCMISSMAEEVRERLSL